MIREFEFYNKQGGYGASLRPYKFEVLITTYELVLKDANTLSRVPWNYLIVDEAHRLKNNDSALYQVQRLLLIPPVLDHQMVACLQGLRLQVDGQSLCGVHVFCVA